MILRKLTLKLLLGISLLGVCSNALSNEIEISDETLNSVFIDTYFNMKGSSTALWNLVRDDRVSFEEKTDGEVCLIVNHLRPLVRSSNRSFKVLQKLVSHFNPMREGIFDRPQRDTLVGSYYMALSSLDVAFNKCRFTIEGNIGLSELNRSQVNTNMDSVKREIAIIYSTLNSRN